MSPFQRSRFDISEEQIAFSSSGQDLYGLLYEPSGHTWGGVVVCPPDGEERMWSQRLLVSAARTLAHHGLAVLRFDYRGQGESSGIYEETTVRTRLEDIGAALALLRGRHPGLCVGLLGTRLGGTLAVAAAAEDLDRPPAVAWEPVLDPDAYLSELLRVNVSTQVSTFKKVVRTRERLREAIASGEAVSINGYPLAKAFVDELLRLDAAADMTRLDGRLLLVLSQATPAPVNPAAKTVRADIPVFWKEHRKYHGPLSALVEGSLPWLRAMLSKQQSHPRTAPEPRPGHAGSRMPA